MPRARSIGSRSSRSLFSDRTASRKSAREAAMSSNDDFQGVQACRLGSAVAALAVGDDVLGAAEAALLVGPQLQVGVSGHGDGGLQLLLLQLQPKVQEVFLGAEVAARVEPGGHQLLKGEGAQAACGGAGGGHCRGGGDGLTAGADTAGPPERGAGTQLVSYTAAHDTSRARARMVTACSPRGAYDSRGRFRRTALRWSARSPMTATTFGSFMAIHASREDVATKPRRGSYRFTTMPR